MSKSRHDDDGCLENEDGGGNEELDVIVDFDDECPTFEATENVSGDVLMHNNALLWQDLLFYWEFKASVKEGDVGRTFKVIKVCCLGLWCLKRHLTQ